VFLDGVRVAVGISRLLIRVPAGKQTTRLSTRLILYPPRPRDIQSDTEVIK